MTNFNKFERILFFGALLCFCSFSYFLYDDSLLFPEENASSYPIVGEVQSASNDVRRKGAESFLWRPTGKTEKVREMDSVFTGTGSEVVLKLNSGSQINIKENSLVTLNFSNGQLELDLKFGDLVTQMSENQKIKIKTINETYELNSSEKSTIEMNKPRTNKVRLKLTQGKAVLKDSKKRATEIRRDLPLLVAKEKLSTTPISKIKPSLQLTTNELSKFTLGKKGEAFTLKWEAPQFPKAKVEISKTSNFSQKSFEEVSSKGEVTVKEPLDKGWYYWRVTGLDETGTSQAVTAPRRFLLSFSEAPQIVNPAQNSQLKFEVPQLTPTTSMESEITWNDSSVSSEYEWQVSQSEKFETVVDQGQTPQKTIQTKKLLPGTYYARVRALNSDKQWGDWSPTQTWSLTFLARKRPTLPKPELITKTIQFDPVKASRTPASTPTPRIKWKKVSGAQKYELQISKTQNFKGAPTVNTKTENFDWAKFQKGRFYFRVQALGADQAKSLYSEVGILDIGFSAPILDPIKGFFQRSSDPKAQAPTADLKLKWTQIPQATAYSIEYDIDPKFSKPEKREVASIESSISLNKPGKYNVRVRAIGPDAKPLTEYSNIQIADYDFKNRLEAPTLTEPKNSMTVFLQQDIEPFIWLNWKPVEKAKTYFIEIASDKDFKKIIIKKELTENKFLIKDKVPYGQIYWRVRANAQDKEDVSEWSQPRIFTLLFKKNENFIE